MKTAVWLLSLSLHALVVKFTVADIDYSICNPLVNNTHPIPMPMLAESFTAHIEWKWLDRNLTIDVDEVQNSILHMGSQVIEIEGTVTKIILDKTESQYITYTQKDGCTVTGLGTFAFYNHDLWLQATPMLYNVAKMAGAEYKGVKTVRNTSVKLWSVCLDLYQYNITVQMDLYFSSDGWAMSMSDPDHMIPVRIEMKGSQNSTGSYTKFHVIGDYVDYNPSPTFDETQLQLPAGVFCSGRASRKPLDLLPESFSLVMEVIDQDYHRVGYQYIWYDATNNLIRYDTKQNLGQDPDPMSEIFDFNLGVHYSIDKYMGNCQPVNLLSDGDLFVKRMGNHTRMESALEFFHAKNAITHYVGTRTTRGVVCDVWVGLYPDDMSGTNFTIEWYFTQSGVWTTGIGGVIETNTLFRMDIWEGGSNKPTIYNVLQLDQETPPLSMFDISPCYPAAHKARILLYFAVSNQGKLSTVGKSYLSNTMHNQLTHSVFIPPLRITGLSIFVSGETNLYVDFLLLDNAPLENKNMVPPPKPQHPLAGVLDFLKGQVRGNLTISFNSTSGPPVVVRAHAVQEINYAQRFTTTTVVTTTGASPTPMSPTLLSPPPPIITPGKTPPSLPPLTSQQTPCPQCFCSKQTCPTCPPQTQCPKVTSATCPVCTTVTTKNCPVCPLVTKPTCPACPKQTSTPCPTQRYHIPTAYAQTGNNNSGSKGLSGGAVAAISISTLVIGLVIGVVALRMYQRYLIATGSERKTILDNYLNDNEKY